MFSSVSSSLLDSVSCHFLLTHSISLQHSTETSLFSTLYPTIACMTILLLIISHLTALITSTHVTSLTFGMNDAIKCEHRPPHDHQVYITFLPQEQLHSESSVSLTFLLLTGCLSYANSAINPILYAFLSENFKKSFAKAFTCATHKDINAQLNVENSVNPRTTRGASSQRQATPGVFLCDSTKRTKRDKNRLRDNFKHEDNDEDDDDDPHAFTNYVVHVNDTRHTGSGRRGQDEEDEDYVDEDEEDEPEVVEIEDSPNAIPMTTRITSYVRGSVMGNRDHGTNRKMNDKQVLLDDPLKHDDRGGLSDPTVL